MDSKDKKSKNVKKTSENPKLNDNPLDNDLDSIKSRSKLITIVLVILAFAIATAGVLYYKNTVQDDANNDKANSQKSNTDKELSEEDKIEKSISDGVEKIKVKTEEDDSDLEIINDSASLAENITSAVVERNLNGVKVGQLCDAIESFAIESNVAVTSRHSALEKSFESLKGLLLAKWKVQDATTQAYRDSSESLYLGLLNLYKQNHGTSVEKIVEIDKYRIDNLLALSLFHDDYDATQVTYRENTLSLLTEYFGALTILTDKFNDNTKSFIRIALNDCDKEGVLFSLTSDIVNTKVETIDAVADESTVTRTKMIQLLDARNEEISRQISVFTRVTHELGITQSNSISQRR